jgi:heme/copper-type cytochrome/quinol oxidase subunit 2
MINIFKISLAALLGPVNLIEVLYFILDKLVWVAKSILSILVFIIEIVPEFTGNCLRFTFEFVIIVLVIPLISFFFLFDYYYYNFILVDPKNKLKSYIYWIVYISLIVFFFLYVFCITLKLVLFFEINSYSRVVAEIFIKANFSVFENDLESFYILLDWVGYLIFFFVAGHVLIFFFEVSSNRPAPAKPSKQNFSEMMSGGFALLLLSIMLLDCGTEVINSTNINRIAVEPVDIYSNHTEPNLTIKAEAVEDAWMLGVPGLGGREFFISRELDKSMLGEGAYRYSATVDNPLVIPVNTNIKLETFSLDGLNYAFRIDEIDLNVPCISGEKHTKVFQIDREG